MLRANRTILYYISMYKKGLLRGRFFPFGVEYLRYLWSYGDDEYGKFRSPLEGSSGGFIYFLKFVRFIRFFCTLFEKSAVFFRLWLNFLVLNLLGRLIEHFKLDNRRSMGKIGKVEISSIFELISAFENASTKKRNRHNSRTHRSGAFRFRAIVGLRERCEMAFLEFSISQKKTYKFSIFPLFMRNIFFKKNLILGHLSFFHSFKLLLIFKRPFPTRESSLYGKTSKSWNFSSYGGHLGLSKCI